MRSAGFGLGKSQPRREQPKPTAPPSSSDLTQLLQSSQKNPDKIFSYTWQPSGSSSSYSVTVVNYTGQKDRRGWNTSAIDSGALGEAEWHLTEELDGSKSEIFAMQSSDALLIQTLMEEALLTSSSSSPPPHVDLSQLDIAVNGTAHPSRSNPQPDPYSSAETYAAPSAGPGSFEQSPFLSQPDPLAAATTPASAASVSPAAAQGSGPAPFEEGDLRRTNIKKVLQALHESQTTGRLICDIGTVTAEVFLASGEPVHAKSCHSIYQDRDTTGDAVLIDLLTWKDGSFKFQKDWPAASKSITQPMSLFLSGEAVAAAPPETPAPAPSSSPATTASKAGGSTSGSKTASKPSAIKIGDPDDLSHVDEVIGEMYAALVDATGFLKYGMFLMLASTEFVRSEKTGKPFCLAAIGLDYPAEHAGNELLNKVAECFESGCQPLDIISMATSSRFYALFPLTNSATAEKTLRYFINNLKSTQLNGKLHGSSVKITIGLAEVPGNGASIKETLEQACKLRRAATLEKVLVASGA